MRDNDQNLEVIRMEKIKRIILRSMIKKLKSEPKLIRSKRIKNKRKQVEVKVNF